MSLGGKVVPKIDALVAGGGVVGMTTALALAKEGLSVSVIEARAASSASEKDEYGGNEKDIRAWAISYSSWNFLYQLGLGEELRAVSEPIWDMRIVESHPLRGVDSRKLHISYGDIDGGQEDSLDTSQAYGLRAARPLGCIVEGHALLSLLSRSIEGCRSVRRERGLRVVGFDASAGGVEVSVRATDDERAESPKQAAEAGEGKASGATSGGAKVKTFERSLRAKLLLGCDGRGSVVREKAGITCRKHDYRQRALVCVLGHEREHRGVAVEWFMPNATFASLPMAKRRSGIVWCDAPDVIERLVAMEQERFLRHVEVRFGSWLGGLSLKSHRVSYPISLSCARRCASFRVALLGDAAHGIHPLAGQGLNLGLRDVAAVAHEVREALHLGEDIGSESMLSRYEQQRRGDVKKLVILTDGLKRLFCNDSTLLREIRLNGVGLLNRVSIFKQYMATMAGGIDRTMAGGIDR